VEAFDTLIIVVGTTVDLVKEFRETVKKFLSGMRNMFQGFIQFAENVPIEI
jgi:hypothetical protein